ncbi:hypothetical protein [Roseibium sediminicola]|uniref:Uncharacterized protein n=1 Tax=Roseibium sediminicola TaxID=2933272 RepID=A0ABT0GUI3_9HYPH|nr:hypothetical protein [Roseibium sp. CAU 1639]MCK7612478.1 hypothetical protein [Roseibium sp. CAU 1639]
MEKLVDPAGREVLDVLLVEEDGRLEELLVEELDADVVLPGLAEDVVEPGLVSVGLPAPVEEVDPPRVLDVVPEPVAVLEEPVGPAVLEPEEGDPELPPRVDPELPVVGEPVLPLVEEPPAEPGLEVLEDALVPLELEPIFSAVRSMVTGRLPAPAEEALLPGLSPAPEPLPPDEDVPPEDFLSVAISSPPEPDRSQDIHYTHLFAKRYRRGKDFCAAQ